MIGTLYGEQRLFTKDVKASKHLFNAADAWGMDKAFFDTELLPNNFLITIRDTENGAVYTATAREWSEKGFVRDFGWGEQIFLPRKYFTKPE